MKSERLFLLGLGASVLGVTMATIALSSLGADVSAGPVAASVLGVLSSVIAAVMVQKVVRQQEARLAAKGVFISYARSNEDVAQLVSSWVREVGGIPKMPSMSLSTGSSIASQILESISDSTVGVVIVDAGYSTSSWVLAEARALAVSARSADPAVPAMAVIIVDDSPPPSDLAEYTMIRLPWRRAAATATSEEEQFKAWLRRALGTDSPLRKRRFFRLAKR